MEAPEDLLFVWDVEQEEAGQVVHPLHITDLVIVIGVGLEHVIKFIVATLVVFPPQLQVRHRPVHILLDLLLCSLVVKLYQLLVEVIGVLGHDRLNLEQSDPELASNLVRNALVYARITGLISLSPRQRLFLFYKVLPVSCIHHPVLIRLEIVIIVVVEISEILLLPPMGQS